MKNAPLDIDKEGLASFYARWQVLELDLFGAALRDDFGPESDVDILAVYAPDAKIALFDEAAWRESHTNIPWAEAMATSVS